MSLNSLPPLVFKSFIGFDELFDEISRINHNKNSNYPAFDVIKSDEKNYEINFNESLDLSLQFKDDPEVLKNIEKKLQLKNDLEMKLNEKVNYFSFTKHALDQKINDDQSIISIIDRGKELINELYGPALPSEDHKGRLPGDPHYRHNH